MLSDSHYPHSSRGKRQSDTGSAALILALPMTKDGQPVESKMIINHEAVNNDCNGRGKTRQTQFQMSPSQRTLSSYSTQFVKPPPVHLQNETSKVIFGVYEDQSAVKSPTPFAPSAMNVDKDVLDSSLGWTVIESRRSFKSRLKAQGRQARQQQAAQSEQSSTTSSILTNSSSLSSLPIRKDSARTYKNETLHQSGDGKSYTQESLSYSQIEPASVSSKAHLNHDTSSNTSKASGSFAYDILKRTLSELFSEQQKLHDELVLKSTIWLMSQYMTKFGELLRNSAQSEQGNMAEPNFQLKSPSVTAVLSSHNCENVHLALDTTRPEAHGGKFENVQLVIELSDSSSTSEHGDGPVARSVDEPNLLSNSGPNQFSQISVTSPALSDRKRSWADIATLNSDSLSTLARFSPSKPFITRQMLEEKLKRAEAVREETRKSRELKMQTYKDKVQQLQHQKQKERVMLQRQLEERLSEAEQRRTSILENRRVKAKDERQKSSSLKSSPQKDNSDSKQAALLERLAKVELRQREIENDRLRKMEENAAKDLAALERRSSIERRRLAKLQTIEERRKELEIRKEHERLMLLAQKETEKEEKARRLAEFQSEKIENAEERRREINQRLHESSKRHDMHIELVKEKAIAVGERAREVAARKTPQKTRSGSGMASPEATTLCSAEAIQRVFDENSNSCCVDLADIDYSNDMSNEPVLHKLSQQDSVVVQTGTVRHEFLASSEKQLRTLVEELMVQTASSTQFDHEIFFRFSRSVLSLDTSKVLFVVRLVSTQPTLFATLLKTSLESPACGFALSFFQLWNRLMSHEPCLAYDVLNQPDDLFEQFMQKFAEEWLVCDVELSNLQFALASEVFLLLTRVVSWVHDPNLNDNQFFKSRKYEAQMNINAPLTKILESNILSNLRKVFSKIHGPIDNGRDVVINFIKRAIGFLECTALLQGFSQSVYNSPATSSKFLNSVKSTEFVGIITLLDSLLLYQGSSRAPAASSFAISKDMLVISIKAIRMLNNIANLNLKMFQTLINGNEESHTDTRLSCNNDKANELNSRNTMSVLQTEFFHLVVFWLSFCTRKQEPSPLESDALLTSLLHELILLLGYFMLDNAKNQPIVRMGQYPVILQQLLMLPFPYFSNPTLVNILYPTLIVACFSDENNYTILRKEISPALLCRFIKDKMAVDCKDKSSSFSPAIPSLHYHQYANYSCQYPKSISSYSGHWPLTSEQSPLPEPTKASSSMLPNSEALFLFRTELIHRFPRKLWQRAICAFTE